MGTLKIENGSINADEFVGDLTGTAKYATYDSTTGKNLFCRGAAPDSGDLNTMLTAGNYRFSGTTANGPPSIYLGYGQALILQGSSWSDTCTQVVFPYNSQNMYFRSGTKTAIPNTEWSTVLTNNNYTNYLSNTYLPLSGGTLTGSISYKGTKTTSRMIYFLDNTEDTTGNGISIGYGGVTIVGAGESTTKLIADSGYSAQSEALLLGADTDINIYSNCQSELSSAYKWTFNKNGNLVLPGSIIYNSKSYGSSLPSSGTIGQIFYKLI